jgi:hypothetical protein
MMVSIKGSEISVKGNVKTREINYSADHAKVTIYSIVYQF